MQTKYSELVRRSPLRRIALVAGMVLLLHLGVLSASNTQAPRTRNPAESTPVVVELAEMVTVRDALDALPSVVVYLSENVVVTDILRALPAATVELGERIVVGSVISTDVMTDVVPPRISVLLSRDVLWPPNHKLVDIVATIELTDDTDPNPVFVLTSVTSNQSTDGRGDGNTDDDIQGADIGTPDTEFRLRSERRGDGGSRQYTVVYTAMDAAGNAASDTAWVRVPHDRSGYALASAGFAADGKSFDGTHDHFALVIPSMPARYGTAVPDRPLPQDDRLLAIEVDFRDVYLGNTRNVLRPEKRLELDVDGDGWEDLVVFYPTDAVVAMMTEASAEHSMEASLYRESSHGHIGLHYRSHGGVDYLVPDIFALGRPVSLVPATPLSGAEAHESMSATRMTGIRSIQPNPFNPATTISFSVAHSERVTLRIYDVRGRLVRMLKNETIREGVHNVIWDGRDDRGQLVATGIYFVQMVTGDFRQIRKAVLLK